MIEVHYTQEFMQFALSGREGELMDSSYPALKGADAMLIHVEAQEVEGGSTEDTLLQVDP